MAAQNQTKRAGMGRRLAERGQRLFTRLTDCGPESRRSNRMQRVLCYVIRLSDAFATHQCSLMACACAYVALLSLVPLLVIGIAVFGFLMGSPHHALELVIASLGSYAPNRVFLNDTQSLLEHIFEDRKLIGLFGLGGLLFAAHQTFLTMEPAFNLVWVVPETRHWAKQRLVAVAATFYSLVLLGVDLAASAFLVYLGSRPYPIFASHAASLLLQFAVALTPMLVITLLFTLLYQFLPSRAVPFKPALLGAVVASLLWQVTKILFGAFLLHVNSYNRLYGSLGSLVILVVWMYYSMAILLLGAEIAADYESMRHSEREAEERALTGGDLAAASGTPTHNAETHGEAGANAQ